MATKDVALRADYDRLVSQYTVAAMTELLEQASPELPVEYHKVWHSWQADNHTKELMRQKVKRLQMKTGVTNYRIYTDLKLNPGNLNVWLKYGDSEKVNLKTARMVLQYVESTVTSGTGMN